MVSNWRYISTVRLNGYVSMCAVSTFCVLKLLLSAPVLIAKNTKNAIKDGVKLPSIDLRRHLAWRIWGFRLSLIHKFYLPDRKHRTILLIGWYLHKLACFIDYGDVNAP